jgi:chemosensory pili system protein ChpC
MQNSVTAHTTSAAEIATLLVSMTNNQVILPNVTVAEIISFKAPRPRASAPAWYLGTLEWRSTVIPVISFEDANAESIDISGNDSRIAIINGVGENKRMPFYAIVVQGIPRLMHISEEDMTVLDDKSGPATLMTVVIDDEKAIIPDLEHLETLLLSIGAF